MAVSQKLVASVLAIGTVSAIAVGATSLAAAQSSTSNESLVDKIATKFNLNKDEVKAVFAEEHAAREAERFADISQDLQEAVDAGELTSDQKTRIENKLKEIQAARETQRTALQTWATDNGIAMKYIMMAGRHGNNSDRLQDAVDDGDITAEQKTLIENKQEELQTARDSQRDELKQWAEDNNVDVQYLHMGGHGRHGGDQRS
jgi:cellobiose-specific phosphotransferase system component IIA